MLHILFLILKIIGIILLFLLGILVFALCAILFIPVKYELKTSTTGGTENLVFRANAVWLLKLFWAFAEYRQKQFTWHVRLFWKSWNQDSDKDEEENETEPAIAQNDDVSQEESEEIFKDEGSCYSKEAPKKSSITRKKKAKKNKQSIFDKFKCTIKKICGKIKRAWNIKEEIVGFLQQDTHQEAYSILKKELTILVKHLRPRTLKGYLRFGMEDPYNTGRILAVLSALYPFYGEKIQIYPDFENEVLEGDIQIKGRMHLITIVLVLLRLFFNKEIRKTYQDYETLKSQLIGGN